VDLAVVRVGDRRPGDADDEGEQACCRQHDQRARMPAGTSPQLVVHDAHPACTLLPTLTRFAGYVERRIGVAGPDQDNPGAPVLILDGLALFGGIQEDGAAAVPGR
jgi:hypothetical protein